MQREKPDDGITEAQRRILEDLDEKRRWLHRLEAEADLLSHNT